MEKLIQAYSVFSKAFQTLKEILREPFTTIVRDASIQRFEYTFEASWKLLKVYLYTIEGIDCATPKSCFRHALSAGIFTSEEVEVALAMCDDRNLTSHTYLEAIADTIYRRLQYYAQILEQLELNIGCRLK